MNNSGQDYNKEEQAIKALQKNYFLCAALTLAVGVGMLAFTSYKVIGIICIVLCVVFGVMGIVLFLAFLTCSGIIGLCIRKLNARR